MFRVSVEIDFFDIYCDNLEEFSCEILGRMFEKAERECKFFPSVAELREIAEGLPRKWVTVRGGK